jgi:nicotinate-nucleotide pyrophosphorylase (carboxylating)
MTQTIITEQEINEWIDKSLYEDVHEGDVTSLACIPIENRSKAKLLVKDTGILAGVALAEAIFMRVDPTSKMEILKKDGEDADYGEIAFYVECNTQALLKAERLVLNAMQRMSGIATLADRFAFEVQGTSVQILDTRKTTPLFRFLEKWAVRIGGCYNYRDGLYDRFMPKDNHVDACGGVKQAIDRIHEYQKSKGISLPITLEVRNLVELEQALQVGGINRIMLDNFDIPIMAEAVAYINGRFEVEASGGITLQNVRAVAKTGVNYISVGALTHSAETLDLSLKIMK